MTRSGRRSGGRAASPSSRPTGPSGALAQHRQQHAALAEAKPRAELALGCRRDARASERQARSRRSCRRGAMWAMMSSSWPASRRGRAPSAGRRPARRRIRGREAGVGVRHDEYWRSCTVVTRTPRPDRCRRGERVNDVGAMRAASAGTCCCSPRTHSTRFRRGLDELIGTTSCHGPSAAAASRLTSAVSRTPSAASGG